MGNVGTILVTGGVGTVGSEVVRSLLAGGHSVRATAHFPDLEAESRVSAADYVEVEYLRPETLKVALRGVSRMLIIVPETPDTRRATRNIMKAAELSGVERVVKLSFLNAGSGKGGGAYPSGMRDQRRSYAHRQFHGPYCVPTSLCRTSPRCTGLRSSPRAPSGSRWATAR